MLTNLSLERFSLLYPIHFGINVLYEDLDVALSRQLSSKNSAAVSYYWHSSDADTEAKIL